MERLGQSIQENLKQAKEVGQQADRLARNFKAEPERIYNEVLSALLSSGEDGKDEREE